VALSVLPKAAVGDELKKKTLAVVRVQGWPLERHYLVVRHVEKFMFRAMTEFLAVLRAEVESLIVE
jgi:hypothetical protein